MTGQIPEGWQGILDEGEAILWQGRPDGGLYISFGHVLAFLFGSAFAGFALFWMIMASKAGGLFWAFGLIHFSVGLAMMFGGPVLSVWTRRHSYYTLTDRRAFIATNMPLRGKRLDSYPITADSRVTFSEGPLSDIHFAARQIRTKRGYRSVPVGFERIAEGRLVMSLIGQVQRSTSSSSPAQQRQDA